MDDRPILVPVDGSDAALAAIELAVPRARHRGAALHLLTVLDAGERAALQDFATAESITLDQAADAYLTRLAGRVPAEVEVVRHTVVADHPAEAILRYADAHDIAEIVLASHGRSGVRRWLLGSVADKIVCSSPVPVTVVPIR